MDVADRVVLITGASSGVGAALAEQLAGMGARVVVNYSRSADAAEAVVSRITSAGGQALAVQADVSEEADCKRLVVATIEQFGQLDVLVNNAGTTTFVPHDQLEALTEEIWLRTLRVNLIGAFMMSREAAPHIGAAGGGEIIMTSSIASMTANGSSIAYCASKAAVVSLTRVMAVEYVKRGLRVNCVCPGGVLTPLIAGFTPPEQADRDLMSRLSLVPEMTSAEEVAEAIAYLASSAARSINGVALPLDKGVHAA